MSKLSSSSSCLFNWYLFPVSTDLIIMGSSYPYPGLKLFIDALLYQLVWLVMLCYISQSQTRKFWGYYVVSLSRRCACAKKGQAYLIFGNSNYSLNVPSEMPLLTKQTKRSIF